LDVVRGRAEFWVSVSDLTSMLLSFEEADRTIYRQALPLSDEDVMDVARALYRDAAPENRAYVYNHFLENCSTRPRDHVDRAMNGALRRVRLEGIRTYREYANEGFAGASWLLIPASDFVLGRWTDRPIDAYAAMFIPEVLRRGVETALGVAPELVYQRVRPLPSADIGEARRRTSIAFGAVMALFAAALRLGTPRLGRFAATLAGVVLGGLGLVLLAAMLLSPLPELRRHELLLVFFPMDLLLASRRRGLVSAYSTMRVLILALLAALKAAGVLLQPLWPFWFLSIGLLGAVRASVGRAGVYSRP
jgi:hypothetical protein